MKRTWNSPPRNIEFPGLLIQSAILAVKAGEGLTEGSIGSKGGGLAWSDGLSEALSDGGREKVGDDLEEERDDGRGYGRTSLVYASNGGELSRERRKYGGLLCRVSACPRSL